MKNFFGKGFGLLLFVVFACGQAPVTEPPNELPQNTPTPKLRLVWETDTLLKTVESAIYDAETDLIYTTNINGHFMAKDGNGSIGKVRTDGTIVEAEWITGLDAPTGTGIFGRKLYVTDIDRIVEIDLERARISATHSIPGAKALNDITIGPDGTVYASDTEGDAIFALRDGEISTVVSDIDAPNGIHFTGEQLLSVGWFAKSLCTVDLPTGDLTRVTDGITNPDGITDYRDDGWLVSSWNGLVHRVDAKGTRTLLLDTTKEEINAADVDYLPGQDLIIVSCFFKHKLMAYRLE